MRQCSDLRARVLKIMFNHLLKLRGNEVLQVRTLAKYEISAMVHEIGFDRFRTLVFQDQNTHFTGTAQPYTVSCISQALYDINTVVKRLERDETTAPQPANTAPSPTSVADTADDTSIGTRIASSYILEKDKVATFDTLGVASIQQPDLDSTELHQHPAKVYLKSMGNVISVLVPLLFLHPMISTLVGDALASMSDDFWREAEAAFTRPSHCVLASFSLDTKAYREEQEPPLRRPSDSRSLSNSSVRRGALLAGETVASIGRRVDSAPLASGTGAANAAMIPSSSPHGIEWSDWEKQIRKHRKELGAASYRMQAWVFEEKGVMVQCRLYVWSVILACALLASGGLVVGFNVGSRITGVDPFNITTYCWVLAAFVLLVAKSVRVHRWPWHDFLHFRVLCRSVSELSSVTGIDEQLVMAYLLHMGTTNVLTTRGPYNSVFGSRSDDGFSIDRPLSLWTMLFSGIWVIEVESLHGKGLVCLDLPHLQGVRAVPGQAGNTPTEGLICSRLREQVVNPQTGLLQIPLERGVFEKYRTIGVYGDAEAVFV